MLSVTREVQESAGLFCVLCNIVHGIQLEEEVEVYSNVCRVRRLLPEIVTSMVSSDIITTDERPGIVTNKPTCSIHLFILFLPFLSYHHDHL